MKFTASGVTFDATFYANVTNEGSTWSETFTSTMSAFDDVVDFGVGSRKMLKAGDKGADFGNGSNSYAFEWVNGELFANVWQSEQIARIDPKTGAVTQWVDLTGIIAPAIGATVASSLAVTTRPRTS